MAEPHPPPPAGPQLVPDAKGTSILRPSPELDFLQPRLERPARWGRVVLGLPGVVALGAGVALWATDGSALGLAFAGFGAVLLGLAVVQHRLLQREVAHRPRDALLFAEGIELVLANGEVRGAQWADPEFAIALVARPAPPPALQEYLLVWVTDGKVPSVELSADGFEAVMRAAAAQHLSVEEHRRGRRDRLHRWIEIKAGLAPVGTASPAPADTPT